MAGFNVYAELIRAQLENLGSAPGFTLTGRVFYRSDLLECYFSDGVKLNHMLANNQNMVLGTSGTANTNVRLNRGGTGKLALMLGGDSTAEGSMTSGNLAQFAYALETFTDGGKPAAAKAGRPIWVSDLAKIQIDTGAAWQSVLTDVGPTLADYAEFTQISTPSTPASGFNRLYFKSDGVPYVKNSAGTETAITLAPTSAVTVQSLSGSGTYTTPAGVRWIRVKMVGAGGGGGGSGTSGGGTGANGVDATFGTSLLIAPGGTGGSFGAAGGAGGAAPTINSPAILAVSVQGGPGGSPSYDPGAAVQLAGPNGGSSALGGAGRGGVYGKVAATIARPSTGGGGGGGSIDGTVNAITGSGGGSGAYLEAIINGPSATYAFTNASVSGGAAGSAGTNGAAGSEGGSSSIVVEEYY